VAYFIGAVLAGHDREAFDVVCYSAGRDPDGLTDTLRQMPLIWRDIAWLDDAASAALIREDGIDILIELGGHTAGNRLTLMAQKPAPVQLTYLGYPNTTGLPAIDYRLTDALADPPGVAEALHSERLLRLDGGFLAYTPPSNMPPVNPLPALEKEQVTFGSFTNLAKVSDTTLRLWSQVLKATTNSRLLVKAREFADDDTRAHFLGRCEAAGIPAARLQLRAEPTAAAAHYATWHEVDMALDTFPYHGTTTTCEALWMGVPLVTLAGDRHAARVGVSLLHAAGLPQLAAQSPAQFVAIARALAQDLPTVAKLRATMRTRLSRTPLLDARRLTRGIEQHLREIWREWCAQQTP
jgi:predicted O-linked N-acetylglucosamine transferase (SPINDLY family)